uniref:Potassium channel toxin alpha-KTx n=1 Tax=Hoffmannihadrurus gertschi TaxID=380989 RepID=KAXU1_HOFGE|nr:RecName: Full=Potassium channel toxin alpha-KTx; Flags: Precursor [Hadrurus gertschi]
MNTKVVLIMLMITSVILVVEAETLFTANCLDRKDCKKHCKSKGCKEMKCEQIIKPTWRCLCIMCSK